MHCSRMVNEELISHGKTVNLSYDVAVNKPFPSCILPLCQNQSSCETFGIYYGDIGGWRQNEGRGEHINMTGMLVVPMTD